MGKQFGGSVFSLVAGCSGGWHLGGKRGDDREENLPGVFLECLTPTGGVRLPKRAAWVWEAT